MFSRETAFSRNLGFLSETEQNLLHFARVAVAGAGGDGGMLAVQLARLGVGTIRVADPEPFESENLNRQAVSTTRTLGLNKASAVGEYLRAINPTMDLTVYPQGVTEENVEEFLRGVDLLVDETEFTSHWVGVMLAREARAQGVPVLMAMNVGFGAVVTTYQPRGWTLERTLGLSEVSSLADIQKSAVPISRWLPYVPPYGDISLLEKVSKGEVPTPSIAPGVTLAASLAATQAILNLVHSQNNRPKPVYAPRAIIMDAMSLQAKVIRFPRLAHYRHLGIATIRSLLNANPKVGWSSP